LNDNGYEKKRKENWEEKKNKEEKREVGKLFTAAVVFCTHQLMNLNENERERKRSQEREKISNSISRKIQLICFSRQLETWY
jgi:hypothetical protein